MLQSFCWLQGHSATEVSDCYTVIRWQYSTFEAMVTEHPSTTTAVAASVARLVWLLWLVWCGAAGVADVAWLVWRCSSIVHARCTASILKQHLCTALFRLDHFVWVPVVARLRCRWCQTGNYLMPVHSYYLFILYYLTPLHSYYLLSYYLLISCYLMPLNSYCLLSYYLFISYYLMPLHSSKAGSQVA